AAERLAKPLRAAPQDLERVKDMLIEVVGVSQLGDAQQFGLQGSPTWVESIESIEPRRKRIIRQASDGVEQVVRETIADLRKEGLGGEWSHHLHAQIAAGAARNHPEKSIWVVAEVIENQVRPVTYEMLGRAVELAEQIGGEVGALVIGTDVRQRAQDLAAHGADKIYVAENSELV